jgi:cleavage and polyadenylation specificity factor subunit 1
MRFPQEAGGASNGPPAKARTPILQCVGKYDLYGHIEAMALVKLPGKERDCLVMVFRDAKMSVVEYSPATDELSTVAIFMFEDEELKRGRMSWPMPPVLRIDPRRRCIALLVYECKLIIIPIRQSGEGDLDDDLQQDDILVQPNKKFKADNATAQAVTRLGAAPPELTQLGFLPSYLIDLEEAADLHGAKGIRGVADFTFLEGYYEPTLCLLHENSRTWVGRLAVTHHTKMITTISLNLSQKRHPCIWGSSRIPHDCRYLVPLPAPVGDRPESSSILAPIPLPHQCFCASGSPSSPHPPPHPACSCVQAVSLWSHRQR